MNVGELINNVQLYAKSLPLRSVAADLSLVIATAKNAYDSALLLHPWSFTRGQMIFVTTAPYVTGTVSVTNGSSIVAGSGTSWASSMVGGYFYVDTASEVVPIKVVSVDSATSLTLEASWPGATLTNVSYHIVFPDVTLSGTVGTILHVYNHVRRLEETNLAAISSFGKTLGVPAFYAKVSDTTIRLHPVPSGAIAHRLIYLNLPSFPTDLSANIVWGIGEPTFLVWGVLSRLSAIAFETTREATYQALSEYYSRRMMDELEVMNEKDILRRYIPEHVSDVRGSKGERILPWDQFDVWQ